VAAYRWLPRNPARVKTNGLLSGFASSIPSNVDLACNIPYTWPTKKTPNRVLNLAQGMCCRKFTEHHHKGRCAMTYMKKDYVGAHCGNKSVIDGHQGLHLLDEYWILALSLTPSVSFDHHTT
jgi:hypothetical protein